MNGPLRVLFSRIAFERGSFAQTPLANVPREREEKLG